MSADRTAAKLSLYAVWSGYLNTYGRSAVGRAVRKVNVRYYSLRGDGALQWWLTQDNATEGEPPRGQIFLKPGALVLPVDRENSCEIEIRGFKHAVQKTEKSSDPFVIVVIARNMKDRDGWLQALQQCIN